MLNKIKTLKEYRLDSLDGEIAQTICNLPYTNKNQQKVEADESQPLQGLFAGFLLGVFVSTLTAL